MPKQHSKKKKQPARTKAKKVPKKAAVASPGVVVATAEMPPKRRRFAVRVPADLVKPKFSAGRVLFVHSLQLLWQHKKLFGGILLIYALLQLILVEGILGSNFSDIDQAVKDTMHGQWGGAAGGFTLLTYLFGSVGRAGTEAAGVYQSVILLVTSLALIWSLRQVLSGAAIRIRDAYYKGMYPLVPFLFVLLVIGLQSIPMLIGAWLYSTVITNGIAISGLEHAVWLAIFIALSSVSFYMLSGAVFALYIVTLPDMTPMRALRSAYDVVRYQRLAVIRKLFFIFIVLLLLAAAIFVPVIMLVPVAAPFLFFLYTVLAIGLLHTYIYYIYRELIA